QSSLVPQVGPGGIHGCPQDARPIYWTYTLNNSHGDVQGLTSSDTLVRSFTAVTADGTSHTVSVTLTGSDDGAVVSGIDTGSVRGDGSPTAGGQAQVGGPGPRRPSII